MQNRTTCNKCGKALIDWTDKKGYIGGNCTVCGEDLCGECSHSFDEDGACGH